MNASAHQYSRSRALSRVRTAKAATAACPSPRTSLGELRVLRKDQRLSTPQDTQILGGQRTGCVSCEEISCSPSQDTHSKYTPLGSRSELKGRSAPSQASYGQARAGYLVYELTDALQRPRQRAGTRSRKPPPTPGAVRSPSPAHHLALSTTGSLGLQPERGAADRASVGGPYWTYLLDAARRDVLRDVDVLHAAPPIVWRHNDIGRVAVTVRASMGTIRCYSKSVDAARPAKTAALDAAPLD